ncbi:MAG: hypothetical protein ACKO2T_18675, partial [Microcystis aeruginosa]
RRSAFAQQLLQRLQHGAAVGQDPVGAGLQQTGLMDNQSLKPLTDKSLKIESVLTNSFYAIIFISSSVSPYK